MSIDVGVGQLVQELEQRGDRLPFEIGAFVALEACEGLLQESVKLEADDVRVTAEGSVVVAPSAVRAEPDEAARSLVSVLSRLLIAAGPGVPPYLLQLVREGTTGSTPRDLRHLHDAIEAALIPLNRGASRRVLARLVRESDRPPAPEESAIDPTELDAELEELLGDPGSRLPDPRDVAHEPVTAKITMPRRGAVAEEPNAPETRDAIPPSSTGPAPDPVPDAETKVEPRVEPEAATVPPPLPPQATQGSVVVSEQVKVDSAPPPSQLAVAAATKASPSSAPPEEAVTATIRVRFPEQEPQTAKIPITDDPALSKTGEEVSRATKRPAAEAVIESATETTEQWAIQPPEEAAPSRESATSVPSKRPEPAPSAPSPAPAAAPRKVAWAPWLLALAVVGVVGVLVADGGLRSGEAPPAVVPGPPPTGTIALTVDPPDAQIFEFIGRGPAVASDLATGSPHEFVVFDRGLRPSRAAVPADAVWETTHDGPRYELAVQAQPSQTDDGSFDLGVPLTESAASDAPTGYVRVVTNPPGAKVYRFISFGPSVTIPVSSIHEGHELLIYHPDRAPQRAVIGPSDWRSGTAPEEGHRAELEATLPPRASETVADSRDD